MWSVLQYNEECPRGDNDYRGLEGHVHDQCHREPQQRLPPAEPWPHDLPQRHGPHQGAIPGDLGDDEKMDHARPELGAGLCGAGYRVSRQADPELAACRDRSRGCAFIDASLDRTPG